jgi:hypothetical protein
MVIGARYSLSPINFVWSVCLACSDSVNTLTLIGTIVCQELSPAEWCMTGPLMGVA